MIPLFSFKLGCLEDIFREVSQYVVWGILKCCPYDILKYTLALYLGPYKEIWKMSSVDVINLMASTHDIVIITISR